MVESFAFYTVHYILKTLIYIYIYIDYLLECWRAEGFIHDANKFRVACEKGHTILHDLINVSLLKRE
jgi:hypothetical protein